MRHKIKVLQVNYLQELSLLFVNNWKNGPSLRRLRVTAFYWACFKISPFVSNVFVVGSKQHFASNLMIPEKKLPQIILIQSRLFSSNNQGFIPREKAGGWVTWRNSLHHTKRLLTVYMHGIMVVQNSTFLNTINIDQDQKNISWRRLPNCGLLWR